jgi:DNA polymerase-3 subunit gamma/tau
MAKRQSSIDQPASPSPVAEYTVLARRYRPQQFADLVGQEPVARALTNALASNRVAHAYLFTGARGVGKTSAARILAKALNCERGPTATPCDQCSRCQGIATGEDVDVLEIDAASNRGIDDIREMRQTARSRPARSRYKIYIIDEVHMLTKEAFNALLKTLEEPPPHVKFIMATTEAQKIPVTILSRCQRFDFAGIPTARIVARLQQVVAGEGMQAEPDALELIARRAGGSMRDAQSLLDQLLAFGSEDQGASLSADQVHRLLGTAHDDRVMALATAVVDRNPQQALHLLGEAAHQGLQLGELLEQLIDYWRDLMVVNCAGPQAHILSVSPSHRDTLAAQAKSLKLDTILAGLDILTTTKARLRGSSHARILLEMALIRLGRLDDLAALSQVARWLAGKGAPEGQPTPRTSTESPAAPPRPLETANSEKKNSEAPRSPEPPRAPQPLTETSLKAIWPEILTQVGPILARHLEKAASVAILGPNALVLRFPAQYNAHHDVCQEPVNVARLEEAFRKVTGHTGSFRLESASTEAAVASAAAAVADNSPSRYRRQRTEALQEPLVKRAHEVLGAQIVHVDEGFGAAPAENAERTETTDTEES